MDDPAMPRAAVWAHSELTLLGVTGQDASSTSGQDSHDSSNFVQYFASRETGERWIDARPGFALVGVDEAFEIGGGPGAPSFSSGRAIPRRGLSPRPG